MDRFSPTVRRSLWQFFPPHFEDAVTERNSPELAWLGHQPAPRRSPLA